MLKKRIYTLIFAALLFVTATAGTGIVADAMGFEVTPQVEACSSSGGGGNC
jgi:hypothetical protein